MEPGVTAGDYLHGFLLGTREALYGNDRQSITITVQAVDARTVGMLIALFERAVGFYASLVNINAYHQPGVEAGKKAAAAVLEVQAKVLAGLSGGRKRRGRSRRSGGPGIRWRRCICCWSIWPLMGEPTGKDRDPLGHDATPRLKPGLKKTSNVTPAYREVRRFGELLLSLLYPSQFDTRIPNGITFSRCGTFEQSEI